MYTIEDGKIKKHIFAGDNSIATIDDEKIMYYHPDHLSGSSVESNKDGNVVEVLDYYPFGSICTDKKYTTYENDKKFTGYELDASGLYYAGQRYYNSEIGRFVSIDPLSIVMGTREAEQIAEMKLPQLLSDPQALNSYAYVKNNPLRYTDPDGQFVGQFGKDMAAGQRAVGNFFNDSADYAQTQGGIIGHSAAFVNHTIGGIFNNTANVFDPDQNVGNRATSLGLIAFDVGTGGEGRVATQFTKQFGRSLGIDIAKQAKHVLGPAYKQGRSIITHSDPQKLINEFAGTGYKIFNQGKLQKEVIDFGQVIGKNIDPKTGQVLDTTRGTIHYGKSGTHLVPALPK